MHTYTYLFHPTRPPDMFAVYHPTRPPDPSPTRGHGTSLRGHHPPGLSASRVRCLRSATGQVRRHGRSSRRYSLAGIVLPALLRTTSFVVASTRQPGAHSRNTRPDRVMQSRRRPGTMPSRTRKSAQQYSCSRLFSLSFLVIVIRLVSSLRLGLARGTFYDCHMR
ncbi:hypothetical protein L226DRAFT_219494 [Lentinus tigrinus ALCF2SS1-7]|uniref:uncharacterized protein n=1 Tax=Lentinus tigrinus ALCF2SS1-7 TaxID=1328758 RepID=UPI0011661055|nr:hypothetical protein L226DRAFT_219494 [Lentinus tigrinus ALCF2SS1-7]